MNTSQKWISTLTIAGTIACVIFLVFLGTQGYLLDPQKLQFLLSKSGLAAPFLFLALQIFQTVIPVIPGGITSAIGVVSFGSVFGFIYNYIGLCIGSLIAFWLIKQYGRPFMEKVCDQKTVQKYIGWLDKGKKFEIFFAFAIFVPGFPDDILCMIAGLTKMSYKKFMMIILLCKPFGLLLYSQGLTFLLQWVAGLF